MLHLRGQSFVGGLLCCSKNAGSSQTFMWDANNGMICCVTGAAAHVILSFYVEIQCMLHLLLLRLFKEGQQGSWAQCAVWGGGEKKCSRKAYALSVKNLHRGWASKYGRHARGTPQHALSARTEAGHVCIEWVACMQQNPCSSPAAALQMPLPSG
jgi:hypothetical protein